MNFIKRFLQAWRDARALHRYEELADSPDYWTSGDGEALMHFLQCPAGKKWLDRLNNIVIGCAMNATRQKKNLSYHCGVAHGMDELKRQIDADYMMALTLSAGAQSGIPEAAKHERDLDGFDSMLSQI
jgi:hypothetical protein